MKSLFLFMLRAYKLTISPFLGQNCRFYPSCSNYADIAIRRHGVIKGTLLAGRRVCKCHPWHPGGVDLVPEAGTCAQAPCDTSQTRLKLARVDSVTPLGMAQDKHARVLKHVANKPASNQPYFTIE